MKAILVMEMPENCLECPLFNGSDECVVQDEDTNCFADMLSELRNSCPLKLMPERKNYEELSDGNPVKAWGNGWNACIDAIEGSGEDGKSS